MSSMHSGVHVVAASDGPLLFVAWLSSRREKIYIMPDMSCRSLAANQSGSVLQLSVAQREDCLALNICAF